uniref:Uncharacterized protein n=1 Tax=Arundo donax TaxID=35708 RepID=A0A0A9A9F9_ARUDO
MFPYRPGVVMWWE